jgi:hypothetical protein
MPETKLEILLGRKQCREQNGHIETHLGEFFKRRTL